MSDDGVTRVATAADGPALCALFRRVTMDADLHLAVERDPEFFALYALQGLPWRTVVLEIEGAVEGLATFLARDAWLGGARLRVGYGGDLRLSPRVRGGRFLGRHFGPVFEESAAALGFDLALTVVIASNRAAMRALVERDPRWPHKPVYTPVRRFRILNVLFTRRRRPRPSAWTVRPARIEDLDAMTELLASDHRSRPFGAVVDAGTLPGALARWPDLGIERFRLAWDARGRLAGMVAPWDARAVKRYRVLGYRGRMRITRAAFNAACAFTGAARLPPAGGLLRYAYLTHVSVRDDDPGVMAALLDRVYEDHQGLGYHFLSACVLDGDPLAPAYARYTTTSLPAALFTMTAPGRPVPEIGPGRPGFEMALV